MHAPVRMKTILWFGLAGGCLSVIGGVLGFRPLIAIGSFCLLLALISAGFSVATRQH